MGRICGNAILSRALVGGGKRNGSVNCSPDLKELLTLLALILDRNAE